MRILVATDFSHDAEIAIELIRGLFLPAGSHVRLVNAVEPITAVWGFAPPELLTISDTAEAEARAELAKVSRTITRPGTTVDALVALGRPADVVVEACAAFAPDLLIVGSRGRGSIATNLLGSVSAEIIDRAPCPVLVARRATLSRVVLADDGSMFAALGARAIADLAPLGPLAIHVVSVVDIPFPIVTVDPTATIAAVSAYRAYEGNLPQQHVKHAAIADARRVAFTSIGLRATSEVRQGEADFELIAAAQERDADCIVVGSRGQTGLRRMMLGSTARDVLYHARCSVLVARPTIPTKTPTIVADRVPVGAS